MSLEKLYGIWDMTSIYAVTPDGEKNYYFGEDALGRLTYLPQGYMSAFIMRQGRRPFTGDVGSGTDEEIRAAFEGFEAYSGKFSVDLGAGTVTHHVDLARLPEYEGTDQVRYFTLEDNHLSIYSPPMTIKGQEWVFYVEWEKLE